MEAKSIFASKTFWFNVAYATLAIIGTVTGFFGYGSFKPEPEVVEAVAVTGAVLNLLLRLMTKQPVKL